LRMDSTHFCPAAYLCQKQLSLLKRVLCSFAVCVASISVVFSELWGFAASSQLKICP
jgi:hypothetical protein